MKLNWKEINVWCESWSVKLDVELQAAHPPFEEQNLGVGMEHPLKSVVFAMGRKAQARTDLGQA